MKSGLEGRNNRPGRVRRVGDQSVSMKSGLEGRNNSITPTRELVPQIGLNEVRPRRPEQFLLAINCTVPVVPK